MGDRFIVTYGGIGHRELHFNCLHALDTHTWIWFLLRSELDIVEESAMGVRNSVVARVPTAWGSSAVTTHLDGIETMAIFGGMLGSEPINRTMLLTVDSSCERWRLTIRCPRSERSAIPGRRRHVACVFQDTFMFVFGGRNEIQFFNDLWIYNFVTDMWGPVTDGASIQDMHRIYSNPRGRGVEALWSCVASSSAERRGEYTFYSCLAPRTGASSFCFEGRFFVYGGFFLNYDTSLNYGDVAFYDILAHEWRHVALSPQGRSLAVSGERCFESSDEEEGGNSGGDVAEEWTKRLVASAPAECTMSACAPESIDARRVFLYGGRVGDLPIHQQYHLNVEGFSRTLRELIVLRCRGKMDSSSLNQLPLALRGEIEKKEPFVAADEMSSTPGF
jgi:hypothetical protein